MCETVQKAHNMQNLENTFKIYKIYFCILFVDHTPIQIYKKILSFFVEIVVEDR